MTEPQNTASRLLTIPQAAAELQVSKDAVYRLISAGEIQTVDVGTGHRARTRIARASLEAFIATRTSNRPKRR